MLRRPAAALAFQQNKLVALGVRLGRQHMLIREVTACAIVDGVHLVFVPVRLALVAVAFVGPTSLASGGTSSPSAAGGLAGDVAEARG